MRVEIPIGAALIPAIGVAGLLFCVSPAKAQGTAHCGNGVELRLSAPVAAQGGLLLLEAQNPRRILSACGQVFVPETEYEREGFVPNVVFPTGIVQQDQTLLVYYGAADTYTALVEFSLKEILGLLKAAR